MKLGVLYLHKGGGIGQYTCELVKSIAPHTQIVCYLAAQNQLLNQFQSLDCTNRVFEMNRGKKAVLQAALTGREESGIAQAIIDDKPDILLDAGSVWWINVIARQLRGQVPLAQVIHDVTPHPGPMYWVEKLFNKLFPVSADALIALSKFSFLELKRLYPRKLCIESRHGMILPSQTIDPHAIAQRRHLLLFFGSITAYKGIDVLLDAYEIAKNKNSALKLGIYGSGQIPEKLIRQAQDLDVELRNEFIAEDEVRYFISSDGLMVLPYTSATQSGVAAVAIANGLPAVATSVGALPEQIIHNRNGLIVPPRNPQALADAILSISENEQLASAMSTEARLVGEELYQWSRIGEDLINNLKPLLRSTTNNSCRSN